MKKKILAILSAIVMAFSFTACAAQDLRVDFDETSPWKTAIGREKTTYSVAKHLRVPSGSSTIDGASIANGEYSTEITLTDYGFEAKASFSITYVSTDDAIDVIDKNTKMDNRGITDSFTSIVRFNNGQAPIYAEKTWVCPARPQDSLQLTPYSYTADYSTGVAKIICGEKEKAFNLESGLKFDNEQLPYIVRAMKSLGTGASINFYNVNPYDCFVTDKYVRYQMVATCAKSTTGINNSAMTNAKYLLKDKEGELTFNDSGAYDLPCIETNIAISSKNSGPGIKFMILDPSITVAQRSNIADGETDSTNITRKLIMSMRYTEYNVASAKEKYNTVFTLSDYDIGPALSL